MKLGESKDPHVKQDSASSSAFELVPRLYYHFAEDETHFDEILHFCSRLSVREVMIQDFCEVEFTMVPEERFAEQYHWLGGVIRRFESKGIRVSLDITCTLGHHGRSDASKRMGFQFAADTNGVTSETTACPLDTGYLEYIATRYRAAAATGAWCIWVNDDFRYDGRQGISHSCFCPLHVAALSKRLGRSLDRSEIVDALQASEPSDTQVPIRSEWHALLRESLLALGGVIRQAVKEVSPTTRLAFMCNGLGNRSPAGMRMADVIEAITADEGVIARPSMGPYTDASRVDYAHWVFYPQLECALLPRGANLYGEIENAFRNRFSKSVQAMRFDCLMHVAQGIHKVTPNYLDSVPGGRVEDRLFEDMFERNLPLLASLARVLPRELAVDTPAMLFSEDFAAFGGLDENRQVFFDLLEGTGHLMRLGIPVQFDPRLDNNIGIVAGKFALSCIDRIQHSPNGLMIDALAAECLSRQGYSEAIGVEVNPLTGEQNREIFCHDDLNGSASGEYVQCRNRVATDHLRHLTALPGTRVLTEIFDCGGDKLSDGVCVTEGAWGRVCVLPFSLACPRLMLVWRRKEQLANLFYWLAKRPLQVFVKNVADVVPFVYDRPDGLALVLANLSIDRAVNFEVELGRPVPATATWQYLDKNGTPCPIPLDCVNTENDICVVRVEGELGIDFMDVRAIVVIF